MINVGIVGLGWPGERHAEAIIASSLGCVHSACDLDDQRLKTFACSYQPKKAFQDYRSMLSDPELHAVIVGVPNSLHYPFSLQALEAGKHVLCEKPPTMSAPQMRKLHEEAQNRDLIYYFGRQMRFSPAMQAAKQLINEGRIGEIYFSETMWMRSRGTPTGLDGWFTDRAKAGGGAMIDLGVHAIDAAWYLMGHPTPRSVSAQVYQKFPQLVRNKLFDVEDNAYGMIRFENAATLIFKVAWAANLMSDIPMSPKRGRSLLSSTVFGPKGSLKIVDAFNLDPKAFPSPIVFCEEKEGQPEETEVPVADLRGNSLRAYEFAEQAKNFLRSIRDKEPAINSSAQAVQLMEILDATYQSSQLGKEVKIGNSG